MRSPELAECDPELAECEMCATQNVRCARPGQPIHMTGSSDRARVVINLPPFMVTTMFSS